MEREQQNIKLFIGKEGHIVIEQPQEYDSNPNTIIIHPSQVDVIVEWLQELKAEILEKQNI